MSTFEINENAPELSTQVVKEYSDGTTAEVTRTPAGDVSQAEISSVYELPKVNPQLNPVDDIMSTANALRAGYKQEEVEAYLTELGYDENTRPQMFEQASLATQAMGSQGYSEEEVRKFLSDQVPTQTGEKLKEYDPQLNLEEVRDRWSGETDVPLMEGEEYPKGLKDRFDEKTSDALGKIILSSDMTAQELIGHLEVANPAMHSVTASIHGLWDEDTRKTVEAAQFAARQRIVNLAAERGLNLSYDVKEGEYYAETPEGPVRVTPEWWRSFWDAKGEIAAGVAGGLLGLKKGAQAGAALAARVPHPAAQRAAILGGTIIGGAIGGIGGAVAGSEVDYIYSAMEAQQDLDAQVMARKALTAAEHALIGEIVGPAVVKLGSASWKGVVKAKDALKKGYINRARTALKESMFLSDGEVDEIVKGFNRVAKTPLKGSQVDQEIAAVATTQVSGDALVDAAGKMDAQASLATIKAVDDRAHDLLKATSELTDENVGRVLQGDLTAYETAVKENFGRVKAAVAEAPNFNKFRFNMDAIAEAPIWSRLHENIANPQAAERFARQISKIEKASLDPNARRMDDLLDLRTVVNEFLYNKNIKNVKDKEMLQKVLSNIDKTIEQGSKYVMQDGGKWLKEFRAANKEYAKMFEVRANTLVKALSRPGISEKAVGQALTKYSQAIDDTFSTVLNQLPKKSRELAEGAVLRELGEKFTAGVKGGHRATNFPLLARELDTVTFTTPDARRTKQAIMQLAEVFKNDVPLAQVTGRIEIPRFQSYLTTDPVVRAKFEVASGMFNWIKSMAPNQKARTLSLVQKTAKVLENPLHSKSINELREEIGNRMDIDAQLEALIQEAAKAKAAGTELSPKIKLYGNGKVLSTTGKGKEQSIGMHRIASLDYIAKVAETYGINRSDTAALARQLKEQGFAAMQLGSNSVKRID